MTRVALQIDALSLLNPDTDTSLLLAGEAFQRGFDIFFYEPRHMALNQGNLYATGYFLDFAPMLSPDSLSTKGHVPTLSPMQKTVALQDFDYILIRQNPPYDMAYVTALDWLRTLAYNPNLKIINSPTALLLWKEKMIPLYAQVPVPPTCFCMEKGVIMDFLDEHPTSVLKPLHAFGGRDVVKLTADDMNKDVLIDWMLQRYPDGVIVQKFLPDVMESERRLIFINGKIASIFQRQPPTGSFRANTALGGTALPWDRTPMDDAIENALGPFLIQNDILLAGVDAIGSCVIEVNITSPTGLPLSNHLYGTTLEKDFWDAV